MHRLLFLPAAAVVSLLQSLPLTWVAWLGRRLGGIAWWLCWHHRRQALVNLDIAYGGELPRAERERIGRENFCRLGEAFACALKTADMDLAEVTGRLQVVGLNKLRPWIERTEVPGVVIATGHFGNLEMYEFAVRSLPWMETAILHRQSPNPLVNRILERMRRDSHCHFFEARSQLADLRAMLAGGNLVLGMMSDLSAGPRGRAVPFFGQPASTSAAPVICALRYRMPLHAAVCFRTGPARWRVEISDEIPTRVGGQARAVEDVLKDLNHHLERSIRRDPANWFWPHPRWGQPGRTRPVKR
jgi:lauroyl/myristoyl acyltransferase